MPKRKQVSASIYYSIPQTKKIKIEEPEEPDINWLRVPEEIQFTTLQTKWCEPIATTRLDRGPRYIGPKPFEEYLYAVGEDFRPVWRNFFFNKFGIIDKDYDRIALKTYTKHKRKVSSFNHHPEPTYITPEEFEIAFIEVPTVVPREPPPPPPVLPIGRFEYFDI